MNSIWNKNKQLLEKRFPQLAELFSNEIEEINSYTENTTNSNDENWWSENILFQKLNLTISYAKNKSITASENGKQLHSGYNPEREAESMFSHSVNGSQSAGGSHSASNADFETGVFFSYGLGYAPIAFAKKFPSKKLILIEPDALRFFAILTIIDWNEIFNHAQIIIALACTTTQAVQLINQQKIERCKFFSIASQTSHAEKYFAELQTLIERNKNTANANTATLEKFAKRWQRNSCKNLRQLELCDGVNIYANGCHSASGGTSASSGGSASGNHSANGDCAMPFLLIAAGPSLAETLPYLSELKKRSVTVAVDTALRACLSVNVEPDFIILTDPQYYAYRHIAGLSSPSSVLIAESAVYPDVFRFNCRKKVLCSSLFPLGQFFEKFVGKKGDLGSGGSVSSVAWNFCQMCGTKEIFCAGLDLAFPKKQTHVPGSTFEQEAHIATTRTSTVDSLNAASLTSPLREKGIDYSGCEVTTDKRMKLFAWWFESRLTNFPEIKTYTFSPNGLAIPGIAPTEIGELLSRPNIEKEKQNFFRKCEAATSERHKNFKNAFAALKNGLSELEKTAKRGRSLCNNALKTTDTFSCQKILPELQKIDEKISGSSIKEITALVFPTERQLEKLFDSDDVLKNFQNSTTRTQESELRTSIRKSQIIYQTLLEAISEYERFL